jgi:hypothetical protein
MNKKDVGQTCLTKDLTESLNFVNFELINKFRQQTSKCGGIKKTTGCWLRITGSEDGG